jgi:hypothetical protein
MPNILRQLLLDVGQGLEALGIREELDSTHGLAIIKELERLDAGATNAMHRATPSALGSLIHLSLHHHMIS